MITKYFGLGALAVASALAVSPPAHAQQAFDGTVLDEGALQDIAGREDVAQIAQTKNTATVANNSVGNGSMTGEVRIDDSAFQNLSGLSLLNINTGNNVAMNSAMNVNIAINPVP